MGRRFSRLKYAINALRTDADSGGVPVLPTGSILDKYQKYVAGEANPTYTRAAGSLPGSFNLIGIKPFGYPNDAANIALSQFSARVAGNADITSVITAAQHQDAADAVLALEGFQPAKAILSQTPANATTTPVTSKITGKSYKKKDRSTYTVPFGQGATAVTEKERRDAITSIINGTGFATYDVGFQSENL